MSWNPLKLGGSAGGLMKSAGARLAALRKTDGTQAEGGVISSSGGRFSKIAKATGIATKMNGDTSAPAQNKGFLGGNAKKVKRNTMFGN